MFPHWIRLLLPDGGAVQLSSFGAVLALGVLGAWYTLVYRATDRERMEKIALGVGVGALVAGGASVMVGGGAPLSVLAGASLGAWVCQGESTNTRRVVMAVGLLTAAAQLGVFLDGSVFGRPAALPEWLAMMGTYPEDSPAAAVYSHALHPIPIYHLAVMVGLMALCAGVSRSTRQLAIVIGGAALAHLAFAPLTHAPPRGEIALATLMLSIAAVMIWTDGLGSRVQASET